LSLVVCPGCQNNVSDSFNYCPYCGFRLADCKKGFVSVCNVGNRTVTYELSNGGGYFIAPSQTEKIEITKDCIITFVISLRRYKGDVGFVTARYFAKEGRSVRLNVCASGDSIELKCDAQACGYYLLRQ